ncbi:hypothetical protein CAPTEDRAFT_205792 [Capitella teleta]|uniref:G-protein coupled receptors family 1 profile domain-containing protein n=1 Tax=Capitella teleta TaxID=283909 RepID=R7U5G3_CAPTE|nr:hypothetical protein CAPTEDRAFT_205792 [Capitella teleta]|eukprot:ELU01214.1 hypothetical protein CAPTEDRAFT_205792 [Capitella teleta]
MASNDSTVPVFGLPGSKFYILHIAAISSLSISIFTSSGVLIYLFVTSTVKNLWKKPIGERLVVYLAVYDLCFSVTHELDHGYMLAVLDNPPDPVCMPFAFFLQTFIMAQALLVLFTSVNAMYMVVLEKRLNLGERDWKLFAITLGVPVTVGFIGVAVPFLGPTGSWCMVDMRPWYGPIVNTVYGMTMVLVFAVNAVCYGAIYLRIRRAAMKTAASSSNQGNKYHKAAKLMMLFVAVYLFQWWTYVAQALWSFAGPPAVELYILSVFLINLGGVYNALVYTIIRKKYSGAAADSEEASTRKAHATDSTAPG